MVVKEKWPFHRSRTERDTGVEEGCTGTMSEEGREGRP